MAKLFGIARLSLVIVVLLSIESSTFQLKEVYSWKKVDFLFPNDTARENLIKSGAFIQENNVPLGLEVWKNKLFITLPRRNPGVAASLVYIDLNATSGNKSPALIPYPNWETHQQDKENGTKIVSVYRLNVDICDRLWMVDSGKDAGYVQVHPPKILVFDLKTDKLIHEYYFKKDDVSEDSFLVNIIVDVTPEACENAFAYVADSGGFGLIVHNLQKNDSWRIDHHFFNFDPLAGDYRVADVNFQWDAGLFGLALSPLQKDGYRTLYFHPLSGTREFAVSTQVLRSRTGADSYYDYKVLGSRGPHTQSTACSLDEKTGVLVYTQVNKNGIGCWNSIGNADEYSADTNALITSDDETLVFPNDLKVDKNGNIWVLSDRFPLFLYAQLNFSDTNFRIFTAPVTEAIKGTVCDSSPSLTYI